MMCADGKLQPTAGLLEGSAAQMHGAILLTVRMLTVRMLMDGNGRLFEKV